MERCIGIGMGALGMHQRCFVEVELWVTVRYGKRYGVDEMMH